MEREWLIPSALLTLLLAIVGIALIPDPASIRGPLTLLPLWILASAAIGGIYALPSLREMQKQGIANPALRIARLSAEHWREIVAVASVMVLAGLNMITFMWTKPLLNHLVPFWADPMLAQADWYLFLGHDPASFLGWLNSSSTALFYHRAWFALMVMTLLMVFTQSPSRDKSALIVTYFLLWSVIGPVIHLLVPAAGPVFYQELGYGDRFAFIHVPEEMAQLSKFLWHSYLERAFRPGAGISAMPSLHIATTVWMMIAVLVFAPRWIPAMAAAGLAIFLLSISLGWHYAVDGVVGGAAAILCYLGMKKIYRHHAQSAHPRTRFALAE